MTCGLWPVYVIPILVGVLQREVGLTAGSAAAIGSAELAATAIASIILGRMRQLRGVNQVVGVGLLLVAIANVTCGFVRTFTGLLILRSVVGAGCGILSGVVTMMIARQAHPERLFGRILGWSAILLTVAMVLLPTAIERGGAVAYFMVAAGVGAMAIVGTSLSPRRSATDGEPPLQAHSIASTVVDRAQLLTAVVALFILIGGLWGVADPIAASHGLSLQATGIALSISKGAGFVGGELSRKAGLRMGRFIPNAIAAIGLTGVAFGLKISDTALMFSLVMGVLGALYVFIYSQLMAAAAMLDQSGGLSAQVTGISLLSSAGGTAAYGVLFGNYGMLALLFSVAVSCAVALCAAWAFSSSVGVQWPTGR
jgi:MFS family permease